MLDLSVVILSYNEEIHIKRCLDNVCNIAKDIFVIDCYSTDKTVEIASCYSNVRVLKHSWPGNQADQFNWALDNIKINTQWVLRLDADEYLSTELINELDDKLNSLDISISAIVLPLGRVFMGRILKHSIVNSVAIIRLFRVGHVRYESRLMDEHLLVLEGSVVKFNNKFYDASELSLGEFIDKHNMYSSREAVILLDAEFRLIDSDSSNPQYCKEVEKKRAHKMKYAKMPLFLRAFAYFVYRYFFRLGFLDGVEGFIWDFFQGCWYRMLIDAKIYEIKKTCGADTKKMKEYINKKYNIEL